MVAAPNSTLPCRASSAKNELNIANTRRETPLSPSLSTRLPYDWSNSSMKTKTGASASRK